MSGKYYENKYLKYKNKYLKYKNQNGGDYFENGLLDKLRIINDMKKQVVH